MIESIGRLIGTLALVIGLAVIAVIGFPVTVLILMWILRRGAAMKRSLQNWATGLVLAIGLAASVKTVVMPMVNVDWCLYMWWLVDCGQP